MNSADGSVRHAHAEADLQEVLQFDLKRAGHEVVATQRGSDAARLARTERPHVIPPDPMLPDLPGMEVRRALEADPLTRGIPVVMLAARGEEIDRIVGFEVGAEDHVVKPFSVRELLLLLHDRRNRVQSRSALLADVWGMTADVHTRTVDTHVERLREKPASAGSCVETVRGVGYRFAESA